MSDDVPYYSKSHCLTTPQLEDYCEKVSTPLSPAAQKCVELTNKTLQQGFMLIGNVQYHFFRTLCKLMAPRRVLEIGTYTGFSALAFSEALEKDPNAHIWTIDNFSDEAPSEKVATTVLGPRSNVTLVKADALETLQKFVKSNEAPFDVNFGPTMTCFEKGVFQLVIFIDADKERQIQYYETIINNKLLSTRGVLITDNVCWYGKVSDDIEKHDEITKSIDAYNKHVRDDPRTQQVVLTVRDGLNMVTWAD